MTDEICELRSYSGLVNGQKTSAWWDEIRPEFERLWRSGISASKIGAALGVTKNAVIGKAGRWNFPTRAVPSKGYAAGKPRQRATNSGTRYIDRVNRIPVPRPPRPKPEPAPVIAAPRPPPTPQPAPPSVSQPSTAPRRIVMATTLPATAPKAALLPSQPAYSHFRTCQEVLGPGIGAGFEFRAPFCGEETEPGKPYCEAHCRKNYISGGRARSTPFVPGLYAGASRRDAVQ